MWAELEPNWDPQFHCYAASSCNLRGRHPLLLTAAPDRGVALTDRTERRIVGDSAAPLVSNNGGLATSMHSQGMTDERLANAGWTCIQPGNGLILCAPPGTGLPPIPPAADARATYDIMAFTLDHEFVHHIKLLRPDLYHGQPYQGGDGWTYVDFLGYYECLIRD